VGDIIDWITDNARDGRIQHVHRLPQLRDLADQQQDIRERQLPAVAAQPAMARSKIKTAR
jgi:hypothetical protein